MHHRDMSQDDSRFIGSCALYYSHVHDVSVAIMTMRTLRTGQSSATGTLSGDKSCLGCKPAAPLQSSLYRCRMSKSPSATISQLPVVSSCKRNQQVVFTFHQC